MSWHLIALVSGLCAISGFAGYALAHNRIGHRKSEMANFVATIERIVLAGADAEIRARQVEGR